MGKCYDKVHTNLKYMYHTYRSIFVLAALAIKSAKWTHFNAKSTSTQII